ncbi:MAG: signal peptidase I [Actinomycetota bacterium]|nr:signal peptidase I [Actinomycetota bacterium]
MSTRPEPWKRILIGITGIAVILVTWTLFAPRSLGGRVFYVITTGNSMEPVLHDGDLVLVKEEATYESGEVVAYVNPQLGDNVVLHRIVRREGNQFVFKGDNNDFIDPHRVSSDELVGKQWVRLPQVGRLFERLREPRTAALVAGALGLLAFGGNMTRGRRRAMGRSAGSGRSAMARSGTSHLMVPAAVGALCFLVLGVLAFGRPTERIAPTIESYRHVGSFDYSADAAPGPVYDGDVRTGDPIFLRLVDSADFVFTYRFESDGVHQIEGAASLRATIAGTNGWERTVPMTAETPLLDDEITLEGTIDLERIEEILARVERSTGVVAQMYSVEISPEVRVTGEVEGLAFEDTFAPVLAMQLDDLQLQLPRTVGAETTSVTEQLAPSRSVDVEGRVLEPNRVSVGPVDLDVETARRIAVVGAIVCLVLLLIAGVPLAMSRDETSRILVRYGSRIVPMRSFAGNGMALAEIDDVDDLAKIAERYDRPILHESDGGNRYLVEGEGLLYVYRGEKSDRE